MNSTYLSQLAGVVLSLVFSYVPGVKDLYAKLDSTGKSGVMAVTVILIACAIYAASCYGLISSVTCDKAGVVGLVEAVIGALVANQATYLLSPQNRVS